ncbi:DUF3888 domain-containing protein [Viridibacillus sp. YIM B01967]|uniref:DUF3888 domain-containing protein n=1 Tax=Viridibacillus soli TaxID=2798301 RepID=A0ABS1HA85_9BACL|nr:DUF3888 domain-containing protein [Viridibacillus soli]MBK3496322.1 DUF3888 domain-containing protein [Viridibacillus soli]
MRKAYLVFLLGIIILFTQPHFFKASQNDVDNKLLNDTLLTTLDPYITEGIEQYYGYSKQYGLYDAKIISIKRNSDGGFDFTVKVLVTTFEAAHNPPYGKETMTFKISPMGVNRISYTHEGDEDEKKLLRFYKESIGDIKQSFHLNSEHYSEYNYNQLLFKAEKYTEYKSLSVIAEAIVEKILNPEIHPPYKNIISPVTFIKGNEGYILFKRADGTNTVFMVKKENKDWIVEEKKSVKGKKMKNELLWYM